MRLLFFCLALLACDGSERVDACSGVASTERCVTFHLTGEAGIAEAQVTSILLWVGYQSNGFQPHNAKLQTVMKEPTSFPVAVGLHLPQDLDGAAEVRVEALVGPGPLGYRFTTVSPNHGEHLHRDLVMQAVQLSGCFDQRFTSATIETDIDCGGQCPPCQKGLRCSSALDCQSTVCGGSLCN